MELIFDDKHQECDNAEENLYFLENFLKFSTKLELKRYQIESLRSDSIVSRQFEGVLVKPPVDL